MANKIMENAKLYSETHREVLDARQIMSEAYAKVKANKEVTAGSTTACVVCLREGDKPGTGILDIANVGDSGALLIRNRAFIHRVHEKCHGFNAPFQLAVVPSQYRGSTFDDTPSDAVRERWDCQEGDVLVLGSDGYFDNMFTNQIAQDAGWVGLVDDDPYSRVPLIGGLLRAVLGHTAITYADPYRVVQRLVTDAYKISNTETAPTPFAGMLKGLGQDNAGVGGKPDDITVVLARVVRRDELKHMSMCFLMDFGDGIVVPTSGSIKATQIQLFRDAHHRVAERYEEDGARVLYEDPSNPTGPLLEGTVTSFTSGVLTIDNTIVVPLGKVFGPCERIHRRVRCSKIREEFPMVLARSTQVVRRTRQFVVWLDTSALLSEESEYRPLVMSHFPTMASHFKRRAEEVGVKNKEVSYPSVAILVAVFCDEKGREGLKRTCRLMWANIR